MNHKKLDANIQTILDTNTKKYNKMKLVEELNELSSELVKSLTKEDGEGLHDKIIEESGDVLLRLEVFLSDFSKKDLKKVYKRAFDKSEKLANYAKTKRYKNV